MGIRVHKCIGYGIKNLKFKTRKSGVVITDPRIKWDVFKKKYEEASNLDVKSFIKFIKNNQNDLEDFLGKESFHVDLKFDIADLKDENFWNLSDCIISKEEFGLPNVFLIIHPGYSNRNSPYSWVRYDDSIDYIEESKFYKQRNRVVDIGPFGIYPYNHGMKRFKAPPKNTYNKAYLTSSSQVDENGYLLFMNNSHYSQLVGLWDKKIGPVAAGEFLEHLKNDWRAPLPNGVLLVLYWLKDCFTDFYSVINDFRPLMYVYWA